MEKTGLMIEHLLLRGMSIKNTESCYGLVINTGHETKVMKNGESAKYKPSRLEKSTNTTIIIIFLIQVFMSLAFSVMGYFLLHD